MGRCETDFMKLILKFGWLVCFLFCCANSFSQCVNKAAPRVGDLPPALQLSQIVQGPNLKEVTWEKLKGKVVVLEFWNTACGPCIQAIPHLNQLVEMLAGKPVVFISVSDDNPDRLKQFLQKRPIKSWLAIDAPFSLTKSAFGIYGIPTTFLVDASGKIAAITHPAVLESKHLEELLAGKPSSLPVPKLQEDERLQPDHSDSEISNQPPTKVAVSIQGPFPHPHGAYNFRSWNKEHTVFEAKKAFISDALAEFFGVNRSLVIQNINLSEKNLYDISAESPTNQLLELQGQFVEMLLTNLGIQVQLTNRELEVYAMTLVSTNVPGLMSTTKPGGGGQVAGGFELRSETMDSIASFFEDYFDKPMVNETKASGLWSVDIKWKMSEAELLPANLDNAIWRLLRTNSAAIKSGNLPQEFQDKITSHDLQLLQAELTKPEDRQFQPDFATVIKAAREQLGLEIKPAKRKLKVVVISSAK
jgi:uncharacterized protein (TIGR03435 family)